MLRFLMVEAAQVTVRSLPEWRSKYFHLRAIVHQVVPCNCSPLTVTQRPSMPRAKDTSEMASPSKNHRIAQSSYGILFPMRIQKRGFT